jgi:hypothetical protein
MTRITSVAAALTLAGVFAVSVSIDAQRPNTVGSAVTISTCVERAQDNDQFVLTNLAANPAMPASSGKVVYWIDKVKELRPHVGHQVHISGTITDITRDEIEVKVGEASASGGAVAEIEGPAFQVKATPAQADVSAAGQTVPERKIPTTLVKLKLTNIKMASERCTAAARR